MVSGCRASRQHGVLSQIVKLQKKEEGNSNKQAHAKLNMDRTAVSQYEPNKKTSQ